MKKNPQQRHQSLFKAGLTPLLLALLWAPSSTATSASKIEAAVASSNRVSSLSKDELISILTLQKRQWANGERIIIILPPITQPSFSQFVIERTGFYPYQLKRRWDRTRFSGRGRAPITANTPQETIELLKKTPNALVFLPADLSDKEVKYVTSND